MEVQATTIHKNGNNGRWTKQQHEKFMEGLRIFGKDWRKIQALIGTRNGAQIRSHAQKFFLKGKKEVDSSELPQNWEQTKESPLQENSVLNNQEQDNQQSFFATLYQKDVFSAEKFDFWGCFIDSKPIILKRSQGLEQTGSFKAYISSNLPQIDRKMTKVMF